MGRRADGQSYGDGVGDPAQLQKRRGDEVSEQTGEDDARHGDVGRAAQLIGQIHADGGGDGLGQQRGIHAAAQAEQAAHQPDGAAAGQHAGENAQQNGRRVLFQRADLLIQRNGQTDRRRGQQALQHARAGAVFAQIEGLEVDVKHGEKGDAQRHGDQQRVRQRRAHLFADLPADPVGRDAQKQAEIGRFGEKFIHDDPPFPSAAAVPAPSIPSRP